MSKSALLAVIDRMHSIPSARFFDAWPFPYITLDDAFPLPQIRSVHDRFFTLGDSY